MRKLYAPTFFACLGLSASLTSAAQCPSGYTASQLNWDYLDYFVTTGTYAGFVSTAQASSQRFAMGPNMVTINAPTTAFTLGGENAAHTGDITDFTGSDVQYTPTVNGDSLVLHFDQPVANLRFALYGVDNQASYTISGRDAAGLPVDLNVALQGGSILTVGGLPTLRTLTANATTLANTSNAGTATISSVAGQVVKTVKIVIAARGGNAAFWLSDINACVTGSFPNNWRNISRPFTGMPAYIITVVNNQFLLLNPANGYAKPFFTDPGANSVNGLAYDPVNRTVYYVWNRSGTGGIINPNNKTIRTYDVDAETLGVLMPDVVTGLGIPTFDNGVESAAASFYGGWYYFGVEGYNAAFNSGRENTIWRIEFDAAQNATRASQVYSARADSFWSGQNRLKHDWSDVAVSNNGILYDFDGAANYPAYYHFNLMTGQRAEFTPTGSGTIRPTQTGVDWAENVFNAGNTGGLSGAGFVVPYNYNGTVNNAQEYPVYTLPGPTYPTGNWSDCAEAFRPLCDFGDAPASYDPDPWSPAVHEKDTAIRLGPTWDREWLKMTPMDATGDGSDEDGLGFVPPFIVTSGSYSAQVQVYNNTGEAARVIAWLDFNGNGTFDAGEACSTVPPIGSMASMQSRILSWASAPSSLAVGSFTYLRIRLVKASAAMGNANATGYYDHGETEDYRVYVDGTPLVVNLLSFKAEAKQAARAVGLNWTTTAEEGLDGYILQRSKDNSAWIDLAQVPATGNGLRGSNGYVFIDEQPLTGKSYYRLKIRSQLGNSHYSEVRTVQLKGVVDAVTIAPNPARTRVTITMQLTGDEVVQLRLTDASGRLVHEQKERLRKGINTIELPLPATIAKGLCFITLQTSDETLKHKLMVE